MISIDLQNLVPQSFIALLGPEFVTAVLDDVAAAARAKWIRLARQQLDSSKRDYIDGIQEVTGEGDTRLIVLAGVVPNMIENGADAYDMRNTLLGPGKGKISKDGKRYRAIPFRHGTPGSKGQSGTPMGKRYGPQGPDSYAWASSGVMEHGQAAQLGKAVYAQAKRLRGKKRLGGKVGHTEVPLGRSMVQVPKLAPWHSTDIYAGMKKTSKFYRATTQSQYTTFRIISEANPTGWIHPGIQARNLHVQVESDISNMLGRIVASAVRNALKGS